MFRLTRRYIIFLEMPISALFYWNMPTGTWWSSSVEEHCTVESERLEGRDERSLTKDKECCLGKMTHPGPNRGKKPRSIGKRGSER